MNSVKDRIKNAVFLSIESYNAFQPEGQKLEKDVNTVLFSRSGFTKEGKLDSMGLVNLLVLIEEKMKAEFSNNFTLDISEIMGKREELLMNLGSLINYLESQYDKN